MQDVEAAWITLWDTEYSIAMECLGPSTRRHKLVWYEPCRDHGPHREKARCLPGAPLWSSVYYQERCSKERPQQRSTQAARNARFLSKRLSWWNPKLRRQEWHEKIYSSLNTDGTKLILQKNKIMERWAEHFDGVLNRSSINDKAIERLRQVSVNESFDVTQALREVQIAIRQLFSGNAPGSD